MWADYIGPSRCFILFWYGPMAYPNISNLARKNIDLWKDSSLASMGHCRDNIPQDGDREDSSLRSRWQWWECQETLGRFTGSQEGLEDDTVGEGHQATLGR